MPVTNLKELLPHIQQKTLNQGDEVDLTHQNLTANDVKKIADAITSPDCPTNLTFYLSGNHIGDEDAKYLAELFESGRCPPFTKIQVGDNNIGCKGARYFAQARESEHFPIGAKFDFGGEDKNGFDLSKQVKIERNKISKKKYYHCRFQWLEVQKGAYKKKSALYPIPQDCINIIYTFLYPKAISKKIQIDVFLLTQILQKKSLQITKGDLAICNAKLFILAVKKKTNELRPTCFYHHRRNANKTLCSSLTTEIAHIENNNLPGFVFFSKAEQIANNFLKNRFTSKYKTSNILPLFFEYPFLTQNRLNALTERVEENPSKKGSYKLGDQGSL